MSIAVEKIESEIVGFVVTFDDVSELLSAQRKAAWSDVARRIAHEIKNPLTPIQLTIDNLKSKYLENIEETKKNKYQENLKTIQKQIKQIENLVNEFSDFARNITMGM